MRVVHIAPSYFHDSSRVGGGERFGMELARAMAKKVPTQYVTFSRTAATHQLGDLTVRYLPALGFIKGNPDNPLAWRLASTVRQADVIHCHGHPFFVTDIALGLGRLLGRRVYMTDMGGGGPSPSNYLSRVGLDTRRLYAGLLLLTAFNGESYQRYRGRIRVIYGGVNLDRFGTPGPGTPRDHFLFVGRVIPVKGVDVLVQAVTDDLPLRVVGRHYDGEYLRHTQGLAGGKPVEFDPECPDDRLPQEYGSAIATILPSVSTDYRDEPVSCRGELLGLVLLESMACGTPVICSRSGGMPEIVDDGVTGFIVPERDPAALRERMEYLAAHPEVARRMGEAGRARVLEQFTWDHVAERCLAAYEGREARASQRRRAEKEQSIELGG